VSFTNFLRLNSWIYNSPDEHRDRTGCCVGATLGAPTQQTACREACNIFYVVYMYYPICLNFVQILILFKMRNLFGLYFFTSPPPHTARAGESLLMVPPHFHHLWTSVCPFASGWIEYSLHVHVHIAISFVSVRVPLLF